MNLFQKITTHAASTKSLICRIFTIGAKSPLSSTFTISTKSPLSSTFMISTGYSKIARYNAVLLLALGILFVNVATIAGLHDEPKMLRYVPNEAYGLGERLEYEISYQFITAGTAVFSVSKEPETIQGRPCYPVRFEVASLKSLDFIYRVRDLYKTWIDIDGLFPWKFEQYTREGGFKKDFKATFDQIGNKAVTTEGTFDVPPFVHDVVSAFYYVRAYDLKGAKKGDLISLQNFMDRESHDLTVKILGRQQITVEAGTFNCIVVEPGVKVGSPFKFDGRLLMWLSDDDRKVPIKVTTQIPIGNINAELTSYRGTRGAISAKVVTNDN
ncbi:MAG: DUF3108 domain-containing protein [Ignavibacteria bacterium]|nr:DUF3108 domain-containing protein [Ignavibacteria bacterium]